ncbi:MAG: TM0106 family RecB-like putative nuclease [Nitrospira sp.]|nr:TM0106 family RecB-like putative nuclease [Nitrospira sp.]
MPVSITASMLYDLVNCPHRVTMDIFGNPADRDQPNPFVQLLWERGTLFEKEVIAQLSIPFVDLSIYAGDEKGKLTAEAMACGEPLIYGGRIAESNLLGDPDLLRKEGNGYIAGDIKSGRGEAGSEEDPSPKKHYGVQVALYTDILERKGLSSGRRAFIWDVNSEEIIYDFEEPYGERNPRTLWQDYQEALAQAQGILSTQEDTLPAYSAACKLCHWYATCLKRLKDTDDLTLIPELGRSKRDVMLDRVETISDFANADPASFLSGKKTCFSGIGPGTLEKFHARARLLAAPHKAKPYLREPLSFPCAKTEIFFDIEVDPMRDLCYLHGFVERKEANNDTERFVFFFADEPTQQAERQVFADALAYMKQHQDSALYYYSKYERTIYRKLQLKYPDLCSADDIETLFAPPRAVDLYFDVVKPATEWPTIDHSIKTLASYLGFKWRDTHPSGAASIQWFDEWLKTGDRTLRQRILDYNEDDCRATRVLLDGIKRF